MAEGTMIGTKLNSERIKKYLDEGKRFDNRNKEEFREIIIEIPVSVKAEGSARVKIGKTEVIAGVKMDVGVPYTDSPNKGNLMVGAEMMPLSSSRFELGKPGFESIELARIVDRGIRESKCIEFEKLCIKEGEKVWTVYVDIYTINDDGNLFDAAAFAALIALKNTKIPKYNEETGKVDFGEWTDKKLPMSKESPISITAYKIGNNFVVDPTREEEDLTDTRITIASSDGTIHAMQKGDSKSMKIEELHSAIDLVENVEKKIFKKLEKFLNK